jgi:hypothetical protein
MNIETAKNNFEKTIERQQADLISYAQRPSVNPAAVQTRKDNLNTLVDYYLESEKLRSEQDMKIMELQLSLSRIGADVQRLIYWSLLHRVNPDMVFQYGVEELRAMVTAGRRFGYPQDLYHSDDETQNEQSLKYLTIQQLCSAN